MVDVRRRGGFQAQQHGTVQSEARVRTGHTSATHSRHAALLAAQAHARKAARQLLTRARRRSISRVHFKQKQGFVISIRSGASRAGFSRRALPSQAIATGPVGTNFQRISSLWAFRQGYLALVTVAARTARARAQPRLLQTPPPRRCRSPCPHSCAAHGRAPSAAGSPGFAPPLPAG